MRSVKMFGPSISDPLKMVDRDVPECDVQAYRAAGYQEGSLPKEGVEDVELIKELRQTDTAKANIVDETAKDVHKAKSVKGKKK